MRPSDFGIQHICLYVDDIDAAARLAAAGGTLLSEPGDLPGGDAGAGNRYVYTRTPWGSTIELVTYPSPQAYESRTELRRWRPPSPSPRTVGGRNRDPPAHGPHERHAVVVATHRNRVIAYVAL